jgi:hypothetical protein
MNQAANGQRAVTEAATTTHMCFTTDKTTYTNAVTIVQARGLHLTLVCFSAEQYSTAG